MKEADFDNVEKLLEIKRKCKAAIVEADNRHSRILTDEGSGGVCGISMGYRCWVSDWSDGSGDGVDLSGCYIGLEVAEFIISALKVQIKAVDGKLTELGVTVT